MESTISTKGDHSAPNDAVELGDPAPGPLGSGLRHLGQRHRLRRGESLRGNAVFRLRGGYLLDEGAPLPAVGAFAQPLRGREPACGTGVLDLYLRHFLATSQATSSKDAFPARTILRTSSYSGTGRIDPSGSSASLILP